MRYSSIQTEGRSTQIVQMSGSCADRNELCTNAGWPCHRDRQIVVKHKLRQCELAQGHHQSSLVLDNEHSQTPSGRLWTECAEVLAANVTCHAVSRWYADFSEHRWSVEQQRAVLPVTDEWPSHGRHTGQRCSSQRDLWWTHVQECTWHRLELNVRLVVAVSFGRSSYVRCYRHVAGTTVECQAWRRGLWQCRRLRQEHCRRPAGHGWLVEVVKAHRARWTASCQHWVSAGWRTSTDWLFADHE